MPRIQFRFNFRNPGGTVFVGIENGGKRTEGMFGKETTNSMNKLAKGAFVALAFVFLAAGADNAMAQGRNREARREYRSEVREARREYRNDVRSGERRREAVREYRSDIRDARRDYRQDRTHNRIFNQTYNRQPYGRANGYYNVRPYRGANRGFYRGRLPQNRYYVPRYRRWR